MIDHVWTVVCNHAVVDKNTNRVSLLDTIEQIRVRDEPVPESVLSVALEIMTLWVRTDLSVATEGRGRVTLLSPSGKSKVGPLEFNVDLSNHKRFRTRGRLEGLPIDEPGQHYFKVELLDQSSSEWREVATVPLEVTFDLTEDD